MPIRTIQKIVMYNNTHSKFSGRHYISVTPETWKTFELKKMRTTVWCEINALLNSNGKPIFRGSEKGIAKPREWTDNEHIIHYDLVFSRNYIKKIGLREGLYVDMLLTHIERWDTSEKIFPKRLVSDIIQSPKKQSKIKEREISENLIEHIFDDQFFAGLVIEINRAYGFKLFSSTMTLLRKLMENLLIELLRTRFGMKNVEKFYSTDKGRHHDFSKLLENFDEEINSFKPYSSSFEKPMINFLNKFRVSSNSAAHSIDINENWEHVKSLKQELNHYSKLFENVIKKIQSET